MKRWWLSFAILLAIAKDAAEMSPEETPVSDVVIAAESSSVVPHDRPQTVAETSTFPVAVDTSYGTATTTNAQETSTVDELRNRVAQQTDELNKANAALSIAQQYEQRMAVLEREKYGYDVSYTQRDSTRISVFFPTLRRNDGYCFNRLINISLKTLLPTRILRHNN